MAAYWIANDGEFQKIVQVADFFELMIIRDTVEAKIETLQACKWLEVRKIS